LGSAGGCEIGTKEARVCGVVDGADMGRVNGGPVVFTVLVGWPGVCTVVVGCPVTRTEVGWPGVCTVEVGCAEVRTVVFGVGFCAARVGFCVGITTVGPFVPFIAVGCCTSAGFGAPVFGVTKAALVVNPE
jgi:hypothetical protein